MAGENSNSIFLMNLYYKEIRGNGGIEHGEISLYCLEWAGGARTALGLRQLPMVGQSNFRIWEVIKRRMDAG